MDTKEQLLILTEICHQDLKLIANREKISRLSRESEQAKTAALELEASISSINANKGDFLKRRKALDEKLQLEKANVRKWESRAEKIKGEREYTALMSEIGTQKRTIAGIEAEIAELTGELKAGDEKLLKATGDREEKLLCAQRAYEEVKELLHEESERLAVNVKAKETLLKRLPDVMQTRYNRIFEKRAQQGIALVRTSICQACMRMIPPELFNRVCKGEIIEQCPSCQRILVPDLNVPNA